MQLNATGDLADSPDSASRKRDWDPEEDAAWYDDHLESYFEAFPEQVPVEYGTGLEGRGLHKRQIAQCYTTVATAVATTYTTVTTVSSATDAAVTPSPTSDGAVITQRAFVEQRTDSDLATSDAATATDLDSATASDSATDSTADSATATDSAVATTTIVTSTTVITSVPASTTTAKSARQRNEMYSWPGAPANETWSYSWKSFQAPGTSTGVNFFHSWQLLRRDSCGGPVITLDYKVGNALITDIVRPTCPDAGLDGACPSVPVEQFWGKTIKHSVTVRYGLQGSFDYTAVDVADATATPLLAYSAEGDMGASGSIKVGHRRLASFGLPALTDR
jgi:hypothetical protein